MKILMLFFAIVAAAETPGEKVAQGAMPRAAFNQPIGGTGLTAVAASGMTLQEIVGIRWQND